MACLNDLAIGRMLTLNNIRKPTINVSKPIKKADIPKPLKIKK